MTPYTDRRNAGHYDAPGSKKTTAAKSTTSQNLKGLTRKTKRSSK